MRTSKHSVKRKFAERPKGELPRIPIPRNRVNKDKMRKGQRRHRPHRHRFYHAPSGTRSPRRLRERGRGNPYLLIVAPGPPLATLGLAGPRTAAHQLTTTVLVALARVPPPSACGFRPRKRDHRTDDSSCENCKRPTPGDGVVSQTARQLV
jgi:hypothetical protein